MKRMRPTAAAPGRDGIAATATPVALRAPSAASAPRDCLRLRSHRTWSWPWGATCFTRACLAFGLGRTLLAQDVVLTRQHCFAVRALPEHIRSDNGAESIAKEIQRWLHQASVGTLHVRKTSPWENGYVEGFNGELRRGSLDREIFLSLPEARCVLVK